MLAKATRELPLGEYLYEPKWDGFRCIVFRDGDEVELGSRNERPLTRYFPELIEPHPRVAARAVRGRRRARVASHDGLDFDLLSQRIHPAESRVNMLAETTPASLVVFDILALDDADLRSEPLPTRREALESLLAATEPPIHLTPATADPATRRRLVRAVRGRRVRWRHGEGDRGGLPRGQARPAQGEAPSHRRLRRRRVPAPQDRRASVRCCSACSTRAVTTGHHHVCTTSACAAPSLPASVGPWSTSWPRTRRTAPSTTPGRSGPNRSPTRAAASACRARRADGPANAASTGCPCGRSWSSR